jgi:hypothetical protein
MSHGVLAKIGAALSGSVAGTSTGANDFSFMVRAKPQLRLRREQLGELVTPERNVAIYSSKDVGAGVVESIDGETTDVSPWFRRVIVAGPGKSRLSGVATLALISWRDELSSAWVE